MTDRAPAPADVEAIAEVLATHSRVKVTAAWPGSPDPSNWRNIRRTCGCGEPIPDGTRSNKAPLGGYAFDDAHRTHVAAALLTSPALATLRAHERANALEAAEEDWPGRNGDKVLNVAVRQWLRDRAEKVLADEYDRARGYRADRQEPS